MPPLDAQPASSRVRRRLAYVLIAVALLLALLVTPPLINVDRYRHRIAHTLSESLGRPVHIDDVKLHLLPLPSLELRNVVVSEDPAFGSEPTIRANRVIAFLRTSSLWRRRVEFGTIRFAADENGVGPSVNLVRNAAGRWNLDSVFMQAAHTATAPTIQRSAGPVPRFPYIEAAAARVNLKLGNEKMPFSLNDAEFALWLPEPGHWHVRLQGRPMRTDANISETGTVRLEGTLQRAATMADVPADLQAVWTDAQLGEATALLTGRDMGWRGNGTLRAALHGPLADAAVTARLELHDLRRADFVPARMLDVTVICQAHAAVTEATLQQPVCRLPAPLPGSGDDAGKIELRAAGLDLTSRHATGLQLDVHAANAWLLDWARLLIPGVSPDENPGGVTEGSLTRVAAAAGQPGFWTGQLHGSVFGVAPWHKPDEGKTAYPFLLQASPDGLDLQPVSLAAEGESPVALRGTFGPTGYTLHLSGLVSPDHVYSLAHWLPPLSEGLSAVLPPRSASAAEIAPAQRVDLGCGRAWSAPEQTCTAALPAVTTPVHPRTAKKHSR